MGRTTIQYRIVIAHPALLELEIDSKLKEGWHIYGNVILISASELAQTIVKYKELE